MNDNPEQTVDLTENVVHDQSSDRHDTDNFSFEAVEKVGADLSATKSTVGRESRADAGVNALDRDAPSRGANSCERFGKYILLEKLGQGRSAVVYLALHEKLRRKVALKRFLGGRESSLRERERFHREIRSLCQSNHPNLVRIETAGEWEEQPYLVMEYVEGIDLFQLVETLGPLSVPDACQLIGQALLGVNHLKREGLVHGDIKPSNIILTAGGMVKLVDFGMSRSCDPSDEVTPSGTTVGKVHYVAPEYLDADAIPPSDCIEADIYSLGCTLFTLLSGEPPFQKIAKSVPEILSAKLRRNPPSLSKVNREVPAGLSKLVANMMARKPADRPHTPLELVAILASNAEHCDLRALIRRAELPGDEIPAVEGEIGTATYLKREVEKFGEVDRLRHRNVASLQWAVIATLVVIGSALGASGLLDRFRNPALRSIQPDGSAETSIDAPESVPPDRLVEEDTKSPETRIDLLESLVPQRDAFDLDTRQDSQSWSVSNLRGRGLLQLPFDPPEAYSLNFTVERLAGDGSFGIGFSIGDGGRMLALLDHAYEQGTASGMYFDDADAKTRFVHRTEQPLLRTDSRVPLRLSVSSDSVLLERLVTHEASDGGQHWIEVSSWRSDEMQSADQSVAKTDDQGERGEPSAPASSKLSLGSSETYYPNALFVHVYKSAFRINHLSLKPKSSHRPEPIFGRSISEDARLAKRIVWRGGHVHIIAGEGQNEVHSLADLTQDPWLIGVTKCNAADRLMIGDSELVELLRIKDLRILDLVYSNVTSDGVAALSGMQNLATLSVGTPNVDGSVLESLRELPQLRTLQLIDMNLSDEQLANVDRFPNLTNLCMTGSTVSDDAMEKVCACLPDLRHLCLSGTDVTQDCLPNLASLSQLEQLQLNNTKISDQNLDVLSTLPNLRVLGLQNTNVSESAVSRLRKKRPNVEIRS